MDSLAPPSMQGLNYGTKNGICNTTPAKLSIEETELAQPSLLEVFVAKFELGKLTAQQKVNQ